MVVRSARTHGGWRGWSPPPCGWIIFCIGDTSNKWWKMMKKCLFDPCWRVYISQKLTFSFRFPGTSIAIPRSSAPGSTYLSVGNVQKKTRHPSPLTQFTVRSYVRVRFIIILCRYVGKKRGERFSRPHVRGIFHVEILKNQMYLFFISFMIECDLELILAIV